MCSQHEDNHPVDAKWAFKMLPPQCPFCDHLNPDRARFCNECGLPLRALSSGQHMVAAGVAAGNLDGHAVQAADATTTALAPALPSTAQEPAKTANGGVLALNREPEARALSDGAAWLLAEARRSPPTALRHGSAIAPRPGRGLAVTLSALVIAVLAIAAYYAYDQYVKEDGLTEFAGAGSSPSDAGRPGAAGIAGSPGATLPPAGQSDTQPAGSQGLAPKASTEQSTSAAPKPDAQPAAATDRVPTRPAAAPDTRQTAALAAETPASAKRRARAKPAPVTERTRSQMASEGRHTGVATVPAAGAPSKTAGSAMRASRNTPSLGPCTDAVAALGLCNPSSK
jgi:hypothetical protein